MKVCVTPGNFTLGSLWTLDKGHKQRIPEVRPMEAWREWFLWLWVGRIKSVLVLSHIGSVGVCWHLILSFVNGWW
jgi:hypothetical protein